MNDLAYINYLFSRQELMVLSACSGMAVLSTFAGADTEAPGEREINSAVFSLYQKGLLEWKKGDSWTLSPRIRPLFQCMSLSKKELQIRSAESQLLCFLDVDAVVMEPSRTDRDMVKLHSLSVNGLFEELQERGILPAGDSRGLGDAAEADEEELWRRFLHGCPELIKDGKIQYETAQRLLEEKEALSSYIALRNPVSGQDQGIALIMDYGIVDGMICIEEGCAKGAYYALELLKAFLMR